MSRSAESDSNGSHANDLEARAEAGAGGLPGWFPRRLFRVDGDLVQHYNRALKKLTGRETALSRFDIDRRGLSPQLQEELGADYLEHGPAHRYVIIVSPDQGRAALLDAQFSFDEDLLRQIYANYLPVISAVTRVDSLYGELDDGVHRFAQLYDLLLIRRLTLDLTTPSYFLPQACELNDLVARLRADPDLLVHNEAAVPQRILELVENVGDVRNFNIQPIKAERDIDSFHTRLFGGAYVFRMLGHEHTPRLKRPHPKQDGHRHGRRRRERIPPETVVIAGQGPGRDAGAKVRYLALRELDEVVEFLLAHRFVRFERDLVDQRLALVEDYGLIACGIDVAALEPARRHGYVVEHERDMPAEWSYLMRMKRALAAGQPFKQVFYDAPAAIKLLLLQPHGLEHCPKAVVGRLLCQLWPYDVERMLVYDRAALAAQLAHGRPHMRNYLARVVQRHAGEIDHE